LDEIYISPLMTTTFTLSQTSDSSHIREHCIIALAAAIRPFPTKQVKRAPHKRRLAQWLAAARISTYPHADPRSSHMITLDKCIAALSSTDSAPPNRAAMRVRIGRLATGEHRVMITSAYFVEHEVYDIEMLLPSVD
jgi:hypothetical protein